jgi:hypothetical protein
MAIQRKWAECGVVEVDFSPVITTTNTAKKWREWAEKENIFVKVKTDSTHAANDNLIQIERCTAATDVPIGTLRSITGDPSNFPSKFVARVGVEAWDINVDGAGTGELADTDFGKKVKPDSDGKASIVDSGGVARVVGGTKANLRLAYDFRDNFR